jgi:hypothetical protein
MVGHTIPIVDGGSIPASPLHIRRITKKQAQPVIETYHYSHHVPPAPGAKFFGWFRGDALCAVALYGIGANKHSADFLSNETGLPIKKVNLIELIRLARIEPKFDDMPLNKFLSVCHKILRKEGVEYVVSYSDPVYNPHGGVYAAANFTLVGLTSKRTIFQDPEGRLVHERKLSKFQERQRDKGAPISRADAIQLFGYTPHKVPPKKRWLLGIGHHKVATRIKPDQGYLTSSSSSDNSRVPSTHNLGVKAQMNHAKISAALHALADAFLADVEAVESAVTGGKKGVKKAAAADPAPTLSTQTVAPATNAPAVVETPAPVAAPAVPSITKDQLNKAVLKVAAKSRDAAEAILKRFGAVNTVTLPPEQWQAVYDAFEEEIAKQDAAAVQVAQASLV